MPQSGSHICDAIGYFAAFGSLNAVERFSVARDVYHDKHVGIFVHLLTFVNIGCPPLNVNLG